MGKIAIITGAGSGLGSALVDILLNESNTVVVSLSRSVHPAHCNAETTRFKFVHTDVSKPFVADSIAFLNDIKFSKDSIYFINNAAVLSPISPVGQFTNDEISYSLSVNLGFTISIINFLLDNSKGRRMSFVNVTSGAARRPIVGWALYSSAKAYLNMFFEIMRAENLNHDYYNFFNCDPGALDTKMQRYIRETDLSNREYFKDLERHRRLVQPADAARKILQEIGLSR